MYCFVFSRGPATLHLVVSVGRSVRPSVRPSVMLCENTTKGGLTCVTAPAHPYATDAVVYTALFVENLRLLPQFDDFMAKPLNH